MIDAERRATIAGLAYAITPVGRLGRHDRREAVRVRDRFFRSNSDKDLRAVVAIQLRDVPSSVLRGLGRAALERLWRECDRVTLRDVQETVTAASSVVERYGDSSAREGVARLQHDVAGVATAMEGRNANIV